MTALPQNYLKGRYKSTCLSKEENIKEALFSEYPRIWWLRVGWVLMVPRYGGRSLVWPIASVGATCPDIGLLIFIFALDIRK